MSAPATYFVYGTLRPGGRYWVNVADYIEAYEPGCLNDHVLYHLHDGYPAIRSGDGKVFGDLLFVRDGEEERVCRIMDRIEEYYPNDIRASLYERVEAGVQRLRGGDPASVTAAIYVYNRMRHTYMDIHGVEITDGDWREWISLREQEAEAEEASASEETEEADR